MRSALPRSTQLHMCACPLFCLRAWAAAGGFLGCSCGADLCSWGGPWFLGWVQNPRELGCVQE